MKLKRIVEDIKKDQELRDIAQRIYEKMLEHLRQGEKVRINPSTDVQKFSLCVNLSDFYPSIMSEYYPLEICFHSKFYKSHSGVLKWRGVNGSKIDMWHVDFEIFFQNKKMEMESPLTKRKMKEKSFKEDAAYTVVNDFEMTSSLRETFFEEIHHYLDYVRTEGDIEFGNKGEYETRDTEVNAKLQSALSTVENDVLGSPERSDPHMEFQEEWTEDFRSFRDWFEKHMLSKNFLDKLSNDQYKRMINRLHGFWENKIKEN